MTLHAPQISVIIAAWKAAQTLPAAVASALAQTDVRVEVIIVDDASPDETYECAQDLAQDARVSAFRLTTNAGPAAARNLALGKARAPWIAVLDADDQMRPGRLAGMLALARDKGADVVLGNLTEATRTPDGGIDYGQPFVPVPDKPTRWRLHQYLMGNMAAANGRTLGYLKPLISHHFMTVNQIRYDETLRNGEDFHLVLACFAAGARVWFAPEPDYVYLRGAGSVSHRADPQHMAALVAADRSVAAKLDDPEARQLMDQRIRQLTRLGTAETVLAALREGRPAAALSAMLRHPAATARLLRQLSQAIRKRIYP